MHLTKEERETIISFGFLATALFLFFSVSLIPQKGSALQSAQLLPYIVTSCMILISLIYFLTSVRKARPSVKKLTGAFHNAISSPQGKQTLFSIFLVAIYVFIAVPYIGYYISSLALILFIFLYYVRRIKPLVSILSSVALTGLLYLIFAVAFRLSLR